MDKSSRNFASDSKRRSPEQVAKPVLARLPDVSAELLRQRPAAGQTGYRFDPPETAAKLEPAPLRQQLACSPNATRPLQPHVFDRGRTTEREARSRHRESPGRESPVLPRTNPFALPRKRMFDSIAPVLRFLALVAMFTAAATWMQIARQTNKAGNNSAVPGSNAAQQQEEPAAKTVERPAKMPTAVGPVNGTPEAGTRVGRARVSNDFATLRGDILPVIPPAAELGGTVPSLASANGNALPRVQTTEAPGAEVARGPAMLGSDLPPHSEGETPEVASLPGFIIEKPSR